MILFLYCLLAEKVVLLLQWCAANLPAKMQFLPSLLFQVITYAMCMGKIYLLDLASRNIFHKACAFKNNARYGY